MNSGLASPQDFALGVRDEIADCCSRFHEVVHIASYWNSATMLYVDPDSGHVLPQPLAVVAGRIHTQTFEAWLSLPLSTQVSELTMYLDTLSPARRTTLLRLLASEKACKTLVPPTATPEECALFCSDLRAIAPSSTGGALRDSDLTTGRNLH